MVNNYFKSLFPKELRRNALVFILSSLAFTILVMGLTRGPVTIGDGSQYIVMFEALKVSHIPFVDKTTLESYQALFQAGVIQGMPSAAALSDFHRDLYTGDGFDTQHFWGYSAAAYLISLFILPLNPDASLFISFIMLHAVIFGLTLCVAFHFNSALGVSASLILMLCSPALWFIDKIHTEFITVCLTVCLVITFANRKYIIAALFGAILSLQNPPFALLVPVILIFGASEQGLRYCFNRKLEILAIFLVCCIHPFYYWSRLGVLTPQFEAGSAGKAPDLKTMLAWLLDPDIGLLPNWPLGIAIILALLIVFYISRRKPEKSPRAALGLDAVRLPAFFLIYFLVCAAAQSTTANVNHGGTVFISRYALWYLCLFYPGLLILLQLLHTTLEKLTSSPGKSKIISCFSVIVLIPFGAVFYPSQAERSTEPTKASKFIQTYFPGFYDPVPEIFAERYSGVGEMPSIEAAGMTSVFSPSCKKVLLLARATSGELPSSNQPCLSAEGINQLIDSHEDKELPFYAMLEDDYLEQHRLVIPAGEVLQVNASSPESRMFLGKGWSFAESWGTWSMAEEVELILPAMPGVKRFTISLDLIPFTYGDTLALQRVSISMEGEQLYSGRLRSQSNIEFVIDIEHRDNARPIVLMLTLPDSTSPAELLNSVDNRKLGVGIVQIVYRE